MTPGEFANVYSTATDTLFAHLLHNDESHPLYQTDIDSIFKLNYVSPQDVVNNVLEDGSMRLLIKSTRRAGSFTPEQATKIERLLRQALIEKVMGHLALDLRHHKPVYVVKDGEKFRVDVTVTRAAAEDGIRAESTGVNGQTREDVGDVDDEAEQRHQDAEPGEDPPPAYHTVVEDWVRNLPDVQLSPRLPRRSPSSARVDHTALQPTEQRRYVDAERRDMPDPQPSPVLHSMPVPVTRGLPPITSFDGLPNGPYGLPSPTPHGLPFPRPRDLWYDPTFAMPHGLPTASTPPPTSTAESSRRPKRGFEEAELSRDRDSAADAPRYAKRGNAGRNASYGLPAGREVIDITSP